MSTSAVGAVSTSPPCARCGFLRVRTEFVEAEDEHGLVDLESQDLGLDERKRLSVDLDEALTSLETQ